MPVEFSQAWRLFYLSKRQTWKIQLPLNTWKTQNLEEWNSHETAFVCVVTGSKETDRERYGFVFIQQKTEGSSENLKITAQLEERDIMFFSNMTSNIFPNFSIDCLHPPQLLNEQHLHANILLSHILCVSCIYLTCVPYFGKYTMQTRSVLFSSHGDTTVQAKTKKCELALST